MYMYVTITIFYLGAESAMLSVGYTMMKSFWPSLPVFKSSKLCDIFGIKFNKLQFWILQKVIFCFP